MSKTTIAAATRPIGPTWVEDAKRLWPRVATLLPARERAGKGGHPWVADELVFYRLVLFLRAGCSWETFDILSQGSEASGRTVRRRLREWRRLGVFERVCEKLRLALPKTDAGYLDALFIRGRYRGEECGLTRHGKGSKLQVLCDELSRPLAFILISANPGEKLTAPEVLRMPALGLPAIIVADKAYDFDDLRDFVASLGSKLLSPHRKNRVAPPRDQEQIGRNYKQRWRVERFFAWLAAWRRVATRWEAKLASYLSHLHLAISLVYIRTAEGLCP